VEDQSPERRPGPRDRADSHQARRGGRTRGVRALNTEKVKVDFGFDTRDVALWLVIAISAIAGIVIGFFGRPRRR